METYINSVIITLVLAVSAWQVLCIGPQGKPIIIPNGANSASFIQQESGQNLNTLQFNPVTSSPKRDYVNPNSPQNSRNSNSPSSQVSPVTQGANQRDYVNPNSPQNGRNIPNSKSPSTQISSVTQGVNQRDYVNPNSPQNIPNSKSSGSQISPVIQGVNQRDYVNPNSPQNSRNIPNSNGPNSQSPVTQGTNQRPQIGQNSGTQTGTRGAVRDYVNPNAQQGGNRLQNRENSPQNGQQFRPSPRNGNLNSRDYVNPNYRPQGSTASYANIAGANPSNFPFLPSPNNPAQTSPVSYASKVSGGQTTRSPIGLSGPFVSGPSTTEKSEEGPSDSELREFSEALLRKDVNNAAKFLTINVQGKTTSQSKEDKAPEKLLVVQPDGYKISTISKLKLLHNNYILQTNENEHVTAQEKQEENDLLDSILSTSIMQHTKNFLISKGKISKDPKDFKDLLKSIWFGMYSRGHGRIGSSGFEHIFLAELKNNEVSGMHNWVYFDQAEMNKIVDYLGYMKKLDLGEKGAILKFHFKLNDVDKPVSAMFIGTSPELEMALYTTCYLFRADRICPLRLNGNNFIIRTYNYRYRGKNMIGSAFPEI